MTANVKVQPVVDDMGRSGVSITADLPQDATPEQRMEGSDAVALAACKLLGITPPQAMVERFQTDDSKQD
jgi:hypothetical protein